MRYLTLLLLLVSATAAYAAPLPSAVDAALSEVERRHADAESLRFTFTMHMTTSENDVRLKYDPTVSSPWTHAGSADEDDEKFLERLSKRENESDRELLAHEIRDLIGDSISLHRSSGGSETYRFSIAEDAKIFGEGKQRFEAAKYLTGELTLDGGMLESLRFFATESFKPMIVAKIESFDLMLVFEEIWENGPFVTVEQQMEIDGSAFFKSFAENVSTTYSGFEKR